MSDYLKAARISENQAWTKRIALIALNAAIDILAESPETPDHASRAALASAVVRTDQTVMAALPKIVMTNEVVRASAVSGPDLTGENVLDSDLEYVVATIWTSTAKSLFPQA
jgi:hypothetical protein